MRNPAPKFLKRPDVRISGSGVPPPHLRRKAPAVRHFRGRRDTRWSSRTPVLAAGRLAAVTGGVATVAVTANRNLLPPGPYPAHCHRLHQGPSEAAWVMIR